LSGQRRVTGLMSIRQLVCKKGVAVNIFQEGKPMPLKTNREIFDLVRTFIAERGRINMLYWAENQDSTKAEAVDEIRGSVPSSDCRTTACIGGLICYFAISEEIARAAEIYDLSANEVQEPSLLGAALLLEGAEDKYELEQACLPLFSLMNWPMDEQNAYSASQTDMERNQVILRRMDNWAPEIEAS
jgi:hypothetical protein